MTDVEVRGTTDPAEIAAVLAILRRSPEPGPTGIAVWRRQRRAALGAARTSGRRPTDGR